MAAGPSVRARAAVRADAPAVPAAADAAAAARAGVRAGQGGRSGGPGGRQGFQGGRDEQDQRPRRPRPEERRYDVGNDAPGARDGQDGPRKGRGAAARGGAKGGPKPAQGGGPRGAGFRRGGAPSRPRELDAKIEQRNRDRYANKPDIKLPKTHPGAEEEGERLQKVLAARRHGLAACLRGADRPGARRGQR
ncbi:hypothetical protein SCALM49S_05179 [Streptomyces californicus]